MLDATRWEVLNLVKPATVVVARWALVGARREDGRHGRGLGRGDDDGASNSGEEGDDGGEVHFGED